MLWRYPMLSVRKKNSNPLRHFIATENEPFTKTGSGQT
jgi:hypothetical protein